MPHHNTVFSQLLKLLPRHEFSSLAKKHDGQRRSDALTRWTQFIAMATAQLTGRSSLRDIEATLASQKHLNYHLGSGVIKRATLGRANQENPGQRAILSNISKYCSLPRVFCK